MSFTIDQGHEQSVFAELLNVEELEEFPLLRGFVNAHPFLNRKIKPRKKKNCSTGHQCGFSCVAKGKVCKADMTLAQLKAHNAAKRAERKAAKAAQGGGSPMGMDKGGSSKAEQDGLQTTHTKNLYGIAMGESDTRTPEVAKKQDAILIDRTSGANDAAKIERLEEQGLSNIEARGVASWISLEYQPLNKEIYAPSGDDYGEGAGVRAAQGLQKLKPYTYKEMESLAKKEGEESDLLPEGTLVRGVSGIKDVNAFLAPYREAVGKDEFREPTFFGTTAKSNLWATGAADIQYVIKSKADGTGQGRMVDQYKNSFFEGEVLYPPYSRFKVTKVSEGETDYSVTKSPRLLSQLPPKFKNNPQIGASEIVKDTELLQAFSKASSDLDSLSKNGASANSPAIKEQKQKVKEAKKKLVDAGYNGAITVKKASDYLSVLENAVVAKQRTKIYMEEL